MPPPLPRATKERLDTLLGQLAQANENTWMLIGAVSEQLKDQDKAAIAFDHALRHNPHSVMALTAAAGIARARDHFDKAIEYFQRALNIKQDNGEVWGSLGHCYLMKDDLQKAYTAYQQALYYLPNPKDARLWYGIGILYDRYGSFEHAEEAFSSVLKMEPNFDKANEIYFRLGIIYKQQHKYTASLDCFKYILNNPPAPLTSWDIWFQIGHVHELEQEFTLAKDAYMRVLNEQPNHAKVLQQLGWLYHQTNAPFANQDQAVAYLTKSLETDGADAQSWYFLGRAFMAGQKYNKAYEAYQQAVYRDGRNPTFWCSIGVLYYQINQYRDALDAYSRAIRLNPYISEVWYNLGTLYESCNNQVNDAIDAYIRALELDPSNTHIKTRLSLLKNVQAHGGQPPPAPTPQDVHPTAYSTNSGPPNQFDGNSHGPPHGQAPPPPGPGYGPPGHLSDPHHSARDLPAPPPLGDYPRGDSPAAFRGTNPPPLHDVDESRGSMSRHAPLAPMDIDRAAPSGPPPHKSERDYHARDARDTRDPREAPYNGHARYDAPPDMRRRMDSPHGSPRRRPENGPYQSYGYHSSASGSGYPASSHERERERERDIEWEKRAAREREARERERSASRSTAQPPYVDPRHPSPRMNERRPQGLEQPRRESPSPDLARRAPHGQSYPSHPSERRQGYEDERRIRPDPEREDARRHDLGQNGNGSNLRRPSVSHEVEAATTPRPPSPAPSAGRDKAPDSARKRKSKDVQPEKGDKKEKKEKPASKEKKAPADKEKKSSGSSLKITLQKPKPSSTKDDDGTATGSSHETSPERTQPAVSRVIDDDYDETAADALMFLHGDRPAESNGSTARAPSQPAASDRQPSPMPSLKRAQPASPGEEEQEDGQSKRLKVNETASGASTASNGQPEEADGAAPAAADSRPTASPRPPTPPVEAAPGEPALAEGNGAEPKDQAEAAPAAPAAISEDVKMDEAPVAGQ